MGRTGAICGRASAMRECTVLRTGQPFLPRSHHVSHILIVEDDRDIADLIAHYLKRAGHTADVVQSGTAALQQVASARPDLVLLDLMLPGVDGLHVCQTLRA